MEKTQVSFLTRVNSEYLIMCGLGLFERQLHFFLQETLLQHLVCGTNGPEQGFIQDFEFGGGGTRKFGVDAGSVL